MRYIGLIVMCLSMSCATSAGARFARPDDLAAMLAPIRKTHGLPALAAIVMLGGKVVGQGAVGVRKAGDGTPVTIGDKFHIGSCTKSMTATLLAMLVEEGKLSWDTTIDRALPEIADSMDPAWRNVTLTDLLAHRSGISGTYPKDENGRNRSVFPGDIRAQRLACAKLALTHAPSYVPGSKFEYSNLNYILAGTILERITGDSWENVIRKRLFEPLGMKSAGFGPPCPTGTVEQPWGHVVEGANLIPLNADNGPILGPAGRVHCSLADWAKYAEMHARGETAGDLLKPDTFKHLHTAPAGDYGFGWLTPDRPWGGGKVLTHAGSNTMNYAVVWIAPKKDFVVVIATNEGGDKAAKACDEVASAAIRKFLVPATR